MTTLAAQQRALLEALFAMPAGLSGQPPAGAANAGAFAADARGLRAYRSSAQALAERTLVAAFPVIAQLLGSDSFGAMAREFWHRHPPLRGDLAQWGDQLAAFLQRNHQLAAEPYLCEVARVEWAIHLCAHAADVEADPQSLALLSNVDPDALTLVLSSGSAVIGSVFPVASIVTAHLDASPSLSEVGEKLRAGVAEHALVWRQGLRPRVAVCSASEAALVLALQGGAPLLSALDNAAGLDFLQWLPEAVQRGLVLGAVALDS